MATPLDRFRMYRDQDQHECGLVTARLNALLTSQSFLLTAGAIVYSGIHARPAAQVFNTLLPIALLGAFTALVGGVAVALGCQVLRMWHRHGYALIAAARRATADRAADDIDAGCYLAGRGPNDWRHRLSIDLLGHTLPVAFLLFWAVVVRWLWLLNDPPPARVPTTIVIGVPIVIG